uniref:Trichohyalin-plectin-homology domain-containing protein n=1 Tax=Rhodnius prolixus TaxID=13249 RepID=T1I396_RHOPR
MAKITVTNKKLPGAKVEALLFTETQWTALKDHVGKAERRVKELEEELKVKESRKKCSEDMTRKWENTFVNLRKKRLEAAVARVEREKTRKYERFLTLQSEQSKKKEALRKIARDNLYEEKDHAKSALSAYKFAEVLKERELQIAFSRKIKETEEEREKEWDRKIIEDVELFNKEEAEEKAKALEKKRKLGKIFVEKLRDNEERKRIEKEARKAEEREAMELNKKEIKEIEKNERLEMESRKRSIREHLIRNRQEIDNQKKIANAEEKEEAAAVAIIANEKAKLAKIRKEKDAELKSAAIKRREKIANTVTAVIVSKEDEKEAIYQKDKARNEELSVFIFIYLILIYNEIAQY